MKLSPDNCSLEGYKISCKGQPQGGHIIHKGEVQGCEEAREILVDQAKQWAIHGTAEIMATQCMAHNVSRFANTPEARKIQLLQKIYQYGWSHMELWFSTFHATLKGDRPELELKRMLE